MWFVLNETSNVDNTLVFLETTADNVIQSHMLHISPSQVDNQTVVYADNMRWGKFYLFVAGQVNTEERVLLHGAMNLPTSEQDNNPPEARRSVEMRYTIHAKATTDSDETAK